MKILTISDSPTLFSGLGKIHGQVIDGLINEGHEVKIYGWHTYDCSEMQIIKNGKQLLPKFYKSRESLIEINHLPKGNEVQNACMVYDIIKDFNPDVILTIGDIFSFFYMHPLKMKCDFKIKWCIYATVEHDELRSREVEVLKYADQIIVPTKFGQRVLESYGFKSECIPYGLSEEFFQSKENSQEQKIRLKAERNLQNKARFITVAQNTSRKNIPSLLLAISEIKKLNVFKKDSVEFYIHTNVTAIDQLEAYLYDLKGLVKKLNIEDLVVFPKEMSLFSAPDNQKLIEEYKASDYLISTTFMEGFGLPIIEAMSCGVPIISNAVSNIPEFLSDNQFLNIYGKVSRGFLVKGDKEVWPVCDFIMNRINTNDLVKCIIEAVSLIGTKECEEMSEKCLNFSKGFVVKNMQNEIVEILEGMDETETIPLEEIVISKEEIAE